MRNRLGREEILLSVGLLKPTLCKLMEEHKHWTVKYFVDELFRKHST
jgi:hypothetical protein